MKELNEKVFEILGDDHPISQEIQNGAESLEVGTVLLAVLVALTDRLDALERRVTGKGVN